MDEQAYHAALEGAVLYDETNYGRIRMRGETAADLLHRLSTNDIAKLKLHHGLRTVLTTPIGRFIDMLTVYRQEDGLIVITGPDQGAPVYAHLRKNIFFNDKVTLEPLGQSHVQLALYGPEAARLLQRIGSVEAEQLALHQTATIALAGQNGIVARTMPIGRAGFRMLVPVEIAEPVQAAMLAAGAVPLDQATFDVLRVEAGYGAVGREISQDYIPLETGLRDAISFTKGCYVGQEIIARMDSRGRMAKTLRGVRFDRHAEPNMLSVPAKLMVDGKEAGDLTSMVASPRFGLIGLAYVRTAHADPGTDVGVTGSDAVGKVIELPFA